MVVCRKRIFRFHFIGSHLCIVVLLLLAGCSSIQSGSYVQLRSKDTLESLAREFQVPPAAILNANRNKSWRVGEWYFIPLRRGIFSYLAGNPLYPDKSYSANQFYGGVFLWPVPSSQNITSRFGENRGTHLHKGVDISGFHGEPFIAADDGEVQETSYDYKGYGKMITIRHSNDILTVYAHADQQLVKEGDRVYRGQIIGLIGMTGRTTGPHLHFEVRKNDTPIDPLRFIQ